MLELGRTLPFSPTGSTNGICLLAKKRPQSADFNQAKFDWRTQHFQDLKKFLMN